MRRGCTTVRRLAAALLGLVLTMALLPLPAAAQDPCEDAGNLTYNCQFDAFVEAPGGHVAAGWWPFVVSGHPAFDQSSESPKEPAQRIWSDGEGFVAGIYQTVDGVTPGATYQAYVGWFVFHSAGPEMGRSIGIDPTGGTDPASPAIVWSVEVWEQKRLAPELVARAVAQADSVTVFLRVNHPRTYGADQAFLDAASLVLDASVPVLATVPTDTPTPTYTPAQSAGATEPVPAAATSEPTSTPAVPTAEPEQTPEPTTTAGDAAVPAAAVAEPSAAVPATATGEATATPPEGTATPPEGTTVLPEGTTVPPEGPAVPPEGTTVLPEGTAVPPEGTTVLPEGTTVPPEGTAVPPEGTTVLPEGTTVLPEGTTVPPEGTTTPCPTGTPRGTAVVWDLRGGSTPAELGQLSTPEEAVAPGSETGPSQPALLPMAALVALGLVSVGAGVAVAARGRRGGRGG